MIDQNPNPPAYVQFVLKDTAKIIEILPQMSQGAQASSCAEASWADPRHDADPEEPFIGHRSRPSYSNAGP